MKDRFKIVMGAPKVVEKTLNDWAESEPGSKLKRTQIAAYPGVVVVLCTYEPPGPMAPVLAKPMATKTPSGGLMRGKKG